MAAGAVAVMRMKEQEVRDAFRDARALNPASAMSLEAIGIDDSMAVRRLKRRAVIREAGPGLFYFDEDVYKAVRGMRLRMALLLLASLLIVFLLFVYGKATIQ
ncbi:MAG TPA: hypothetical protein VF042_04995 [Gemmatimonadaceae bacterium]